VGRAFSFLRPLLPFLLPFLESAGRLTSSRLLKKYLFGRAMVS
jgi:hypothetical protein